MFVTRPSFEELGIRPLAPKDTRHWIAVALSNHSPWFLLTHRLRDGPDTMLQTIAISWESTLQEFIDNGPLDFVVALNWVTPLPDRFGDWQMRPVAELWTPASDEEKDGVPMLIKLRGEPDLYDSFEYKAVPARNGRQLLLHIPFDSEE